MTQITEKSENDTYCLNKAVYWRWILNSSCICIMQKENCKTMERQNFFLSYELLSKQCVDLCFQILYSVDIVKRIEMTTPWPSTVVRNMNFQEYESIAKVNCVCLCKFAAMVC